MPKLKLFKTVIGFHDAFVAAPSRKAALAAWGASTDLFSAGLAEQVADDACPPAMAKPGAIVTTKRGSSKEWSERAKVRPKPPSKADAERARAEQRLARMAERHAAALAALDRQIAGLIAKRGALEAKQAAERDRLRGEIEN
ncbi:hypothetical protein [Sphingomonas mesophila]|uniref:hypothetical protein n=1 Tax=Sphingomonas mesophila TaxID=2303576 RepID=UPI000E572840|nr:hypothetical protein [Sphingomonas mesophila]